MSLKSILKKPLKLVLKAKGSFFLTLFKRRQIRGLLKHYTKSSVPIYVISFNQLTYLENTLTWLKKYGYTNVTVIDNASTYEPLLKFYDEHKDINVVRLKKNYGFRVFECCPKFWWTKTFHFFVVTDPDLLPIDDCPDDFVEQFLKIMLEHYKYPKVGFSLKYDDLPDDYQYKKEVVEWESHFYEKQISADPVPLFDAELDTTFSLNSPWLYRVIRRDLRAIRTGAPYEARHLPWYGVKNNEEAKQYRSKIQNGTTTWNGNYSKEELKERMRLSSSAE